MLSGKKPHRLRKLWTKMFYVVLSGTMTRAVCWQIVTGKALSWCIFQGISRGLLVCGKAVDGEGPLEWGWGYIAADGAHWIKQEKEGAVCRHGLSHSFPLTPDCHNGSKPLKPVFLALKWFSQKSVTWLTQDGSQGREEGGVWRSWGC